MTCVQFVKSFKYAFQGIASSCSLGRNFKVQLFFAVLAVILGIVFHIGAIEWATVVICIGTVLGGECINTAIEAIVDLASPDYHELAKRAKDCAAGGVLVFSFASIAVAAFVFLPRFLVFFEM